MTPSAMQRPVDITYREGLTITWNNGMVVEYPPLFLRDSCPCAGCVDEMSGQKTIKIESIAADIHIANVDYVGRYALRIAWSDGHNSGIYSFQYLQACYEHAAQQPSSLQAPHLQPQS